MKKALLTFITLFIYGLTNSQAHKIDFSHLNVKDGLSQVNIYSIYQDETGALWFGSLEGINRYNGHSFTVFTPSQDEQGLTQNEIMAICGDRQGNVYIQALHDLIRYDIRKQTFHRMLQNNVFNIAYQNDTLWAVTDKGLEYHTRADSLFHIYTAFSPRNNAYRPLCITQQNIYIGTNEGLMVVPRSHPSQPLRLLPQSNVRCLYQDTQGHIWVGTQTEGIYRLSADGKTENHRHQSGQANSLSNNQVRSIVEDDSGDIWIGTFYGLNRYNPSNGQWEYFVNQPDNPYSLSHSSVFALYKDTQGGIWIGTYYGGINHFNQSRNHSNFYEANPESPTALNFPFVGMMTEDKEQNLWIGTEGGGLNYLDRTSNRFSHYLIDEPQARQGEQKNIKCLWYQPETGRIYLGTHNGGLVVFDTHTRQSHTLRHSSDDTRSLPSDIVNTLQYYKGRLVVSSPAGICAMNMATETFEPLSADPMTQAQIGHYAYETFHIDRNDNLWLASGIGGVSRINLHTGETRHFHPDNPDVRIGKFKVVHIFESQDGSLFFATVGSGLFQYQPATEDFYPFTREDDLLYSNYCYYVTEVRPHELAVLHNRGISYIDTQNRKLRYIHQVSETSFCQGSSLYHTADGMLYLGGIHGLLSLSTASVPDTSDTEMNLYFDQLTIDNRLIAPGDESGILTDALPYTTTIHLRHDQNNLSVETGTSHFSADNHKYEYRLKGFDSDWHPLYASQISYTNLSPGHYELTIRKTNEMQTVCGEKSLDIHIHPPFYANPLAYLIYLLATGIACLTIILFNNRQARLKASLIFAQKEKEQVEELNRSKMRFFANISHEFRTPLTLIRAQLEPLIQSDQLPPALYNRMLRIYKNADHMTTLISELLDIHKQEQGHLKLKASSNDVVAFTKEVYMFFYEYAQKRHIRYLFESDSLSLTLWFDPGQMQKVILNLLSNAFKYTPDGGTISVGVQTTSDYVHIQVRDTGCGIPQEAITRIFERFFQIDGQTSQFSLGTGIGLALAQSIVELHRGHIGVESRLDEGSCFTVSLRTGNAHFGPDEIQTKNTPPILTTPVGPISLSEDIGLTPAGSPPDGPRPSILLVEDNEELLGMLADIFAPTYDVHTARNGLEGWDATQKLLPDLVLSDVMMPEMSGKKMCHKIKNHVNTSHIPVVLLTALSSVEYAIEGYMYGADDYITKPFHAKLLVSRCNNLVNNRRLLIEKFRNGPKDTTLGHAINTADKALLDKATRIIRQHFEDPEFNMNALAAELGVGRNKLYTRIKELTGMTPNELTLKLKLDEACLLLDHHKELNISEISDRLGFSSTPYFSKCFRSVFGVSPLTYRKRNEEAADVRSDEQP